MDFYYLPESAPCRSVQMLAKTLGVDLNLKYLNLSAGEQLKPEFLKINPQHTIPTLVDNGVSVWESRAILIYLAEKYGKDDSLFPKDPVQQAVVNRLLYFDMGTLYQRFGDYYYPQMMANLPAEPEKFKKMEEAVDFLNTFIGANTYAAGDKLTIADIALVATISTYEATNFDLSSYPNVDKWYKLMEKDVPGFDINQKGIEVFKQYLKDL